MAERALDDTFHPRRRARRDPVERDERRVDVRPRAENLTRDRMRSRSLRRELNEHGHRAVGLCGRRREEPVGDLPLHHHAPVLQLLHGQALGDDRRRDVVRQVRHELPRRRIERRDVEPHRVTPVHLGVRDAVEVRRDASIDLGSVDEGDTLREVAREDAESRADLEHDIVLVELREPTDHAQDVVVDEEVLAEALLRAHAHRPKTRSAFATICARTSSPCSSASTSWVCVTNAGSLRFPRTGCGARYGLSVSARSNSGGTSRAAARRSYAFLYVTLPANETYQPRSSAAGRSCADEKQCSTTGPSCASSRARVSSSAARVWTTTGFLVSRATASCRSNSRCWAS